MASDFTLPGWLGWLCLLLGIGLILYLLSRVLQWTPNSGKRRRRTSTLFEVTEGEATEWEEALGLAREALRAGDLRRCLWLSHRLLLHRLDQAESIVFEKSKTNRAYLRECRPGPHSNLLGDLTALYEDVIYAHRPTELARVTQLFGEVERL